MKLAVLGAGAWGRALAKVASQAGHTVTLWSRHQTAIEQCDGVIIAVPAQSFREVLHLAVSPVIISAAKGIEQQTGLTMSEVAQVIKPKAQFFVLSGPSFAADVMAGLPTAVTLAGQDMDPAAQWASHLARPNFRIYASDDIVGVELGGAIKNVLAIACGISDGCGLGESARAGLITRGFVELSCYGRKLGARIETLTGLSGLGDLLLTASSPKSRNYAFGFAIGSGVSVAEAIRRSSGVVEGAYTATIVAKLAHQHNVDMPIISAVAAIVDGHSNPAQEIARLLARPIGAEHK